MEIFSTQYLEFPIFSMVFLLLEKETMIFIISYILNSYKQKIYLENDMFSSEARAQPPALNVKVS